MFDCHTRRDNNEERSIMSQEKNENNLLLHRIIIELSNIKPMPFQSGKMQRFDQLYIKTPRKELHLWYLVLFKTKSKMTQIHSRNIHESQIFDSLCISETKIEQIQIKQISYMNVPWLFLYRSKYHDELKHLDACQRQFYCVSRFKT